ncbi:MAG: chromosome segregation protein [Pseudomonadota bacterium]
MRLNQIKLSGFKSFAEPTTFQLPGQRVGVVGPNGCGKSNIMDAVRWVLGESKASELRGESMQDVIFNGSGQRKPAGRASVELIFDNASARAGGQWNQYAEIAVKRVLTRDGNSTYYLNNQPVRRRDVQDVFLGTGLGPRAYAIIGQGTISRIIESRPEELRLFLEEAAGVSKYKERRRETEHRLRDTRDNLTRVEDILRELNANLDKLERQAEVAQRYRTLQQAGTLKLQQLWFLKHRDAAGEQERLHLEVLAATNALDARLAELRASEAELEQLRQDHYAASDTLHAAQGALAQAALEVSRLEERIRYVIEGRRRIEQRLAELQAQQLQWQERRAQAEQDQEQVAAQHLETEERSAVLMAQVEEQAERLPQFDDALRQARQQAASQRAAATQVQQQIQLLAAESRNLDQRQRELATRRDRLGQERRQLVQPDLLRLEELQRQHRHASAQQQEIEVRLQQLGDELPELEQARRAQQQLATEENTRQADLSARLEALRALQERVQVEGKLQPWLQRQGLQGLAALWRRLQVEPGWETALEAALRERLQALPLGQLDLARAFEQDAPPARLAFYSSQAAAPAIAPAEPPPGLGRLQSRLRLHDDALKALLQDWLSGAYTAPTLADALAARQRLQPGELILTPAGHAVSALAVSFYAPDSEQAGLLQRAQDIDNLETQSRAQALIADQTRAALLRLEARTSDVQQRLAATRRDATEAQTRSHQLQVELLRLTQQAEQVQARQGQLDDELAELEAQLEALQEQRALGEARFEELDLQLAEAQEQQIGLEDAVQLAERRLDEAREQQRRLEREAQESLFAARTLRTREAEMQRLIETATQQLAEQARSHEQLLQEQAALDDSAHDDGLQAALAERLAREAALAAARSSYDELAAQLRRLEEQRQGFERSLAPLRERITQLQLEQQAAQLGGAQFLEQLQAAEVDLAALAQGIEAGGVRLHGLQSEIDRINRELNGLGAVNLAALEELAAASERKQFLDSQNADLTEAMQTLEDAIRKIDLETRDLLTQTFDFVNEHFGRMFPSLFGGGQARLVMTGDEILDAGVQVMAQPPGKKNSTIHLLSGGEKALTAIALVFAIFQLNPAPFCLLDEVDAPLDDANTERYARLVKSMSGGTQFLFISHNRIAMEMAEQLVGVTMQEQGVSRIVAVDMDVALRLADSGA